MIFEYWAGIIGMSIVVGIVVYASRNKPESEDSSEYTGFHDEDV